MLESAHSSSRASPATTRSAETFDRAILRSRPEATLAVATAIGVDLPTTACRALAARDLSALWLGPEEWLLLASPAAESRIARLAEKLAGSTCSLVDVSHRQVALIVEGGEAETILASGCPLDLALPAFPVGMCTRTLFHKAEIVLWRTAPDRFHIEVWRSFAPYVDALLSEAESEG